MKQTFFILALLSLAACSPEKPEEKAAPVKVQPETPMIDYTLGATLPHDSSSYTEGFLFHNGQLFESTGSPKGSNFRSVIGIVDLKSGKLDVKAELDTMYFGEGLVFLKERLYQVTWQHQRGFIYDASTFRKTGQFNYTNKEGWGMTTDGTYIIMSDGTENLTYFDADFKPVKTLSVKENGYAQESLNELEYINGYLYANVWLTGYIVKIDPSTGNVVGKLNLTATSYTVKNFHPHSQEMNGIAYDPKSDKIYITGKAWPAIYEIKFAH